MSFNTTPSLRLELNNSSVRSFAFLRLCYRKLHSSLIIFLSISMRVILPISLLLSAVVAPTVSRSVPSSRCFLSHYVPSSFIILCRDTCAHMQAYVYSRHSFFSFYPLIASRHPLVNMIFLNSYPLAPYLCYVPLFLLLSVEFHSGLSSRIAVTSLILPTIPFAPSPSLSSTSI